MYPKCTVCVGVAPTMTGDNNTPDPQWALTLAIRTALELHGRFEAEVDTRDRQSVVDLHWAGRQAGRLLGTKVKVDVGPTSGPHEHVAMVTVRSADGGGAGRALAEEGLRRLLRSVASVQDDDLGTSRESRVSSGLP